MAETSWIWGALCGVGPSGWAGLPGGLILSLFAMGLAGSAGHCLGMCGPFVLGQVSQGLEATPVSKFGECARLRRALLPAYHLGRLTAYGGLGALVGGLGAGAMAAIGLAWLPSLLLGAAAAALGLAAMARLGFGLQASGLAGALLRHREAEGYWLGVVVGFLPCGLLYAGLIAAGSAGSALAGAAAMAALALGTQPMLMLVGYLGLAGGRRWLALARRAGPALMTANALSLLVLAIRAWPA